MRESLRWTRDELDPDHKDGALDRMVIVGHSMGGLLTSLDDTLHAIGMGKKNLPSGIANLRVDGRFVKILDSLPMTPDVPVHSIIGNKKEAGVVGGFDGVVDYTCSHLDSVVSEKIVKSGHNVQKTAEGIREVRRILQLHRDQSQ